MFSNLYGCIIATYPVENSSPFSHTRKLEPLVVVEKAFASWTVEEVITLGGWQFRHLLNPF